MNRRRGSRTPGRVSPAATTARTAAAAPSTRQFFHPAGADSRFSSSSGSLDPSAGSSAVHAGTGCGIASTGRISGGVASARTSGFSDISTMASGGSEQVPASAGACACARLWRWDDPLWRRRRLVHGRRRDLENRVRPRGIASEMPRGSRVTRPVRCLRAPHRVRRAPRQPMDVDRPDSIWRARPSHPSSPGGSGSKPPRGETAQVDATTSAIRFGISSGRNGRPRISDSAATPICSTSER